MVMTKHLPSYPNMVILALVGNLLQYNHTLLHSSVCSLRAQCILLGSALIMTPACWRPSPPRGEVSTTTLTPMRRCVCGGRGGEAGEGGGEVMKILSAMCSSDKRHNQMFNVFTVLISCP